VAIIGPRQTVGKTAVLECAAITDITVFDQPLHVWTAHEFKTSRKAFIDMKRRLSTNPDYRDRVKFDNSHGEEAIHFELGGSIEFHARSGGSGRGFTTSRITFDEALFLRAGDMGALVPTLVTMDDAQVRYASSAGLLKSAALREIRNRGRDPQPEEDLAYIEFAADRRACELPVCAHVVGTPGCALDDRALWWQANSGLWYGRATFASMAKQRRKLPPEEFAREFFSWWDEPGAEAAFGVGKWEACAGEPPPRDLPVGGLAVAVSFDLTKAAIVASAVDDDNVAHVVPLQHGPGTGWVARAARKLQEQFGGVEVAIDAGGPAADLIPKLLEEGVALRQMETRSVLDACAGIWKRVQERRLQHNKYPELGDAAAATALPLKSSSLDLSFGRGLGRATQAIDARKCLLSLGFCCLSKAQDHRAERHSVGEQ
jgi:hypothetical protein